MATESPEQEMQETVARTYRGLKEAGKHGLGSVERTNILLETQIRLLLGAMEIEIEPLDSLEQT